MTGANGWPAPHAAGNSYSLKWYAVFADTISGEQTEREAAFVARCLPLPRYRRLIDLCCGSGRHARALAAMGYHVTGVDVNAKALAEARVHGGSVRYIRADMRQLEGVGTFADAVICLWQGFGHWDDAANTDVLRQMAAVIVQGGRVLLDVYNREFFESRVGVRTLTRGGERVTEHSRLVDRRLTVNLRYRDGCSDRFEWCVYTPDELETLAADVGLRLVASTAGFDETRKPNHDCARMQLVFERVDSGASHRR